MSPGLTQMEFLNLIWKQQGEREIEKKNWIKFVRVYECALVHDLPPTH